MEPDAGFSSCSSWFFAEPRFGFREEPNPEPSSGFREKEPRSGFREEPRTGFFMGSSKNLGSGFHEEPLTNPEPKLREL
ncbi:hypothetical protein SLEP1_g56333 [Rubroshorea leprosula]|uniref:Uncharacterized protein n=1 Tax=Rubroshorea leprosula TaxID=152421 RepID=A0AAV5ML54_9ROSI|nr:hypothetical protein SLEP1_g56333 [Rubroshorea leprosula]